MEMTMRTVEITKEPVELFKILKFEGLVATGGEAKLVIAQGLVSVNGETETRKRRKIVSGDIIVWRNGQINDIAQASPQGRQKTTPAKTVGQGHLDH